MWQTEKKYRDNLTLLIIDWFILVIFTIEAGLRLAAEWPQPQAVHDACHSSLHWHGRHTRAVTVDVSVGGAGSQRYFHDLWNVFDFVIVVVGLIDVIVVASGINLGGDSCPTHCPTHYPTHCPTHPWASTMEGAMPCACAGGTNFVVVLRLFRLLRLLKMVRVLLSRGPQLPRVHRLSIAPSVSSSPPACIVHAV